MQEELSQIPARPARTLMTRRRFAELAATTFMGTALAPCKALATSPEIVSFPSSTYKGFRQVFLREAPTAATVTATLSFPDEPKDRYPAIVIVHTIAGYREANEGWHAAAFRKAGFATLTYDSFASRGLDEATVIDSTAGPPFASAVADAFAALQFLSNHQKIDATRIFIAGFSFGGEVAHLTALERLQSILGSKGERFAAHIAWYPAGAYAAVAEREAYTGAPILMLLGEKDDNLPVTKIEDYLEYAKHAGYPTPITTLTYKGAYHAWTVSSLGAPLFYPRYGSTRKCPFILFGPTAPSLLVDRRETPFDPNLFATCVGEGRGYTMGFDAAMRTKSTADAIAFLQRQLQQH